MSKTLRTSDPHVRRLYKEPEKEQFIFRQPQPFHTSEGFMPKGMPCMLISPGGSGKSWALLQAAIAAATGTKWFNYFQCERPMKVVYISAEDSLNQMWRRARKIFFGHNLDQSPRHKDAFNDNFFPIPLNGLCLEICDADGQATNEFYELEKYLHTMQNIELLILDPASSFHGWSELALLAAEHPDYISRPEGFERMPEMDFLTMEPIDPEVRGCKGWLISPR